MLLVNTVLIVDILYFYKEGNNMLVKHITKKGNVVILRDDDTISFNQVTRPELTYSVDELILALEYFENSRKNRRLEI